MPFIEIKASKEVIPKCNWKQLLPEMCRQISQLCEVPLDSCRAWVQPLETLFIGESDARPGIFIYVTIKDGRKPEIYEAVRAKLIELLESEIKATDDIPKSQLGCLLLRIVPIDVTVKWSEG